MAVNKFNKHTISLFRNNIDLDYSPNLQYFDEYYKKLKSYSTAHTAMPNTNGEIFLSYYSRFCSKMICP